MKTKYNILAICAIFALLAVPFACVGCSAEDITEPPIVYGEWITETAPTCEKDGLEIRTALSDPNIVETRAIPAFGHDWNGWETVTEPTCLVAGVETRSCKTCENSDMRAIPALGHAFGEWETVLAADCEHDGSAFRVCGRDDSHTEYTTINALGHDFGDWVTTLAPTCTTSGIETRYCRNNNKHTEVRTVEPYGHNWGPAVTTVAATCTEPGEKVSVCVNDSTHTQVTTIKAIGHDYGDWVTSVQPTESEDGTDIRVCRHDSSHVEMRTVDALGSELLYYLDSERTGYKVKRCSSNTLTNTVYIPATVGGMPVTEIDTNAFLGCSGIERIVFLGNNIKTIGNNAFSHCTRLKSIELPEGLVSIGQRAFTGCKNLKSVSFPSTVREIGSFDNSGQYVGLYISGALETMTVAEDNPVFKVDGGCLIETATGTILAGTNTAVIPDYITTIARWAFYGSNIESVRIPASVSSIETSAFSHCDNLREVIFENGALTALNTHNASNIFGYCANLERVVFSDNITHIGAYAFSRCSALREIVFGKNLQTIGSNAFRDCNAIEICEIPAGVTSISGTAFPNAVFEVLTIAEDNDALIKDGNRLINVKTNTLLIGDDDGVIPSYIQHIGDEAFYMRKVKSIVIPSSVQTIGTLAFYSCTSLTSVEFEAGSQLEIIFDRAFADARPQSFEIPETVTSVGYRAFSGWTSTQTLKVKAFASQERADAVWGEDWRDNCSANIVYEGDGLRYILNADGTEYSVTRETLSCTLPGTVVIPAAYKGLPVTEISARAFEGCKMDNIVFLGNNLRKVGTNAFSNCKNIQILEFPEGLTTVSPNAFTYCINLKSISFPSSVREIGYNDFGKCVGAFRCPALETITVAEGNEFYKVDDGCLIEIAKNAVVTGTKTAVIPDYVTEIFGYAFLGSGIESLVIPSSVATIGTQAFGSCANLREVVFENGGVTSIPMIAFVNCSSLERVVLSDNITEISNSAFINCTSLREIVFGNNLQKIGVCAFMYCNALQTIVIPETVTSIASSAFRHWTAEQTIKIKGFATEDEADEAWGGNSWRGDCKAVIIYEGGDAD